MKHRTNDTAPIRLSKRQFGINAFRVEGWVYSGPVRARWDGRWLFVSKTLWDHAMVAVAVEEAFAEAGISSPCRSPNGRTPESLMLALVTCCDQIDRVSTKPRVIGA